MAPVIRWKLNEVMARKRIRNKDLAEALEITENSVYRLRKTDEMPRLTPERLDGICSVLECQPGDLLEWVPGGEILEWLADERITLAQDSSSDEEQAVPKQVFNALTKFCDRILALSWEGYTKYGAGAVVYIEKPKGPEIAYIERSRLSDPDSLRAIDSNRQEEAAVVIYYYDSNYDTENYSILILTGSSSPPECYERLSRGLS